MRMVQCLWHLMNCLLVCMCIRIRVSPAAAMYMSQLGASPIPLSMTMGFSGWRVPRPKGQRGTSVHKQHLANKCAPGLLIMLSNLWTRADHKPPQQTVLSASIRLCQHRLGLELACRCEKTFLTVFDRQALCLCWGVVHTVGEGVRQPAGRQHLDESEC